ncbi:MAG: 50S ribosomal protein L19e [Thermoprotei archaeon]|nr:MAG: 50S ribosomal protein L19e [Thermoprotei archaeon]
MSAVDRVKRLAAEVLGVGVNHIWIDPNELDRVSRVITKEEVRSLIKEGIIRKRPIKGVSRHRAVLRHQKEKRGRRKGSGSRKGPRIDPKEQWISKIRAQRKFLRMLRDRKIIDRRAYRMLYRMCKGGAFRSIAHLKLYIKEHNLARKI